jgi:hypothetical protein
LPQPARELIGTVSEDVPVLLAWTGDLETVAFARKDVCDADDGLCTKFKGFEQGVLRIGRLEAVEGSLVEDKVPALPLLAGEEGS